MSAAAALLSLAVLPLAGCGASTSAGAASAGGANSVATAAAQALLSKDFAGQVVPPPSTGPKAVTGKTVWLLSCLGFEGCRRIDNGVMAAAKVLGWTVKVVDTKADPTTTIATMKDAIVAHADGIIELPLDCPVIKAGLLAARAAKVPVLSYGGLDCDYPKFGGGPSLFATTLKFGGENWAELNANEGKRAADFVLAEATVKGISSPSILQIENLDQTLNASEARGFSAEIKAKCPSCRLDQLNFLIPQLVAGEGESIFKSGMLAHPADNVLYYAADFELPLGLQSAVDASSHKFSIVCCGDGGSPGLALVRAGVTTADNSYPLEWGGWAIADAMNRVFAGQNTFPSEGSEILFVDKTHNLPPAGQVAKGSYDFAAAYTKVWTGQ